MNNRMTTFTPQKAYLLIGLALIAQYIVAALASNLIFMPYADPEKLQNLVKIISPTGFLLLLMYVPRIIGVIVFWLIARIVPFERKAGSKIGFGSIMQLFFIMYAVSSVFNAIGTGIKMLSPADAASQTDQLSDILATGNIGGFVIVLMLAPIFEGNSLQKAYFGQGRQIWRSKCDLVLCNMFRTVPRKPVPVLIYFLHRSGTRICLYQNKKCVHYHADAFYL